MLDSHQWKALKTGIRPPKRDAQPTATTVPSSGPFAWLSETGIPAFSKKQIVGAAAATLVAYRMFFGVGANDLVSAPAATSHFSNDERARHRVRPEAPVRTNRDAKLENWLAQLPRVPKGATPAIWTELTLTED